MALIDKYPILFDDTGGIVVEFKPAGEKVYTAATDVSFSVTVKNTMTNISYSAMSVVVYIGFAGETTGSHLIMQTINVLGSSKTPAAVNIAPGKSKTVSKTIRIPKAENIAGVNEHIKEFKDATGQDKRLLQVWAETICEYDDPQFPEITLADRDMRAFGELLIGPYWKPKIGKFNVARTTDGVEDDESEKVTATIELSISSEANFENMTLRLYYKEGAEADTSTSPIWLKDNMADAIGKTLTLELSRSFSNGSDWNFLLVFTDYVNNFETVQARGKVSKAFANLHLSGKANGGACFGGFSSSTDVAPKLESYYPTYLHNALHVEGKTTLSGALEVAAEVVTSGGIKGVTNYVTPSTRTGGTWINGKPVIRRIVSGAVEAGVEKSVGWANSGVVEQVIRVDGGLWTGSAFFPFGYYVGTSNYIRMYVSKTAAVINSTRAGTAYFIIEYTRVADEPGGNTGPTTYEPYEGSYVVTPRTSEQTLPTQNTVLIDDVTVHKIPYSEVSNNAGGTTSTIG